MAICFFLALVALPSAGAADACRLESKGDVNVVRKLISPDSMIVEFCWYCDAAEPIPLRVKSVEFIHTGSEQVAVTAWADKPPSERLFPIAALLQAERDGSGPLADFIRQDIQKTTDTTGYLGPNDPYFVQEIKGQFAMRLRFARHDHDMRSWDELTINGKPADPRLLYVPVGGDKYRSVGHQVGCLMDNAPRTVAFRPVERDPKKIAPPVPFVADVTGQCYDGACPQKVWRAIRQTPLFGQPNGSVKPVGKLESGEELVPVRSETHVTGSRLKVSNDHGKFFAGDVLYLLDSQAEGFYRVWHYGDVFVIDATGILLTAGWRSCLQDSDGCWAKGAMYPTEVWWSKVRRADGSGGWVRDPMKYLDGVLRSD